MAAASVTRPAPSHTTLTEEQSRAIGERTVSVALSAGAGCGKTFVLTERFLSYLEPGDDGTAPAQLGELIAITFTDRAAREMRSRIRAKCLQRLQSAGEAQSPHWTGLLRDLDSARVSTIHAFCGNLLRSHAVEARLDPGFVVLDQVQADTLLVESIDDMLRQRLADRDERLLNLVVEFGLERLGGMVRRLLGQRQEIDFAAWLARSPEEVVQIWNEQLHSQVIPAILRGVAGCSAARSVLRVLGTASIHHPEMLRRRDVLLDLLPRLAESRRPADDLGALRENAQVKGAGGKKQWDDESAYTEFMAAATKLRDAIDAQVPCCEFEPRSVLADAAAGLDLLHLAHDALTDYERRKETLGRLDFNDLLIRATQLLHGNDALRHSLARNLRLLLVDEFQDTDPLQVRLVKALCGDGFADGKLFFVGDFKQSIYRFRGAQPQVFRRLQDETPARGRLPLTLNFRSQPAILKFVNALFCDAFGDQYAPLRAHRSQKTPEPAVEFLWAISGEAKRTAGATGRARRQEAEMIARRLQRMLTDGVPRIPDAAAAETGGLRPLRPGDVCILFRALSDVSLYEQELQRHAIDYYLVGGHAFYAQQEIFDLLNLLRSLASPADEVSLAGVLRSPFFSLADETLFWLSRHPDGLTGGLFDRNPPISQLDSEQRRRVRFAASTLGELRARKDRLPVAELIDEALARTGYDAALLAEFLGERKLANLRKLVAQARSLDQSGLFSLADFIVQLSQFVAEQPKEALAATHPESTDVVRLMTIHQAKGLEFPVVVVADIDRQAKAPGDDVLFSSEMGPLVKVPSIREDDKLASGHDFQSRLLAEEEERELVRLFYVATTRTADWLILSSSLFDEATKPSGPWSKLLAERFDLDSGECLAKLPRDYSQPNVAVITKLSAGDVAGRRRATDWPNVLAEIASPEAAAAPDADLRCVAAVRPDLAARRQYSFSRLSGDLKPHSERPIAGLDEPAEGAADRLDPLGLGTLVHAVLADVDYCQPGNLAALVHRHAEPYPAELQREIALAEKLLARFFESPRAGQLKAAADLHRELEFLLAWPPGETMLGRSTGEMMFAQSTRGTGLGRPGGTSNGGIYLRGFIDCLHRDAAGCWHLLDYKTNQVTAADLAAKAELYRMQMYVYALAAETVLHEPPASLTLHFLRGGLEHAFDWNDAARRRVVELVNQGIAAAV